MTDQYVGEIRSFGFNFAPVNWALCNGQILPISQYAALYSLLGTYYGGNGTSTFGLPNLQGSVPMCWGTGATGTTYAIGEITGSASVTLISGQIPMHSHPVQVSAATTGFNDAPSSSVWLGDSGPARAYSTTGSPNTPLSSNAIGPAGGGQAHENRQPFLTINFCIAMNGIYPPRS